MIDNIRENPPFESDVDIWYQNTALSVTND